ncbi:MAG: hypothetical protein U9R39_08865 [Campylobacterota bacterium]|nr:hypothetical protein [Campylobacterota bacterium]
MILTPEILAIFILNTIFLAFATVAFILSIKIYLGWDLNSNKQKQYKLEKNSYLTATIIKYIFAIKLPLFLFFIFTLDKVSTVLTGAMCAAGVVDATEYGMYLFILKIINLYLFGFWLILHKLDISNEHLPYTKLKFGFFILAFLVFLTELILETIMFASIDPAVMVSCCGTLYSATSASYISTLFQIEPLVLLGLFYGNFILLIIFYFYKNSYVYAILNILFLIIAIISLISIFGTYIYELPTHHCPFCFLQKDYYYVGYLIYSTLFAGTFFGLATPFFKKVNYYKISILFIIFYTFIVTAYPTIYYIKNGVWL